MIKSIAKDLKREASFQSKQEVIDFLKESNKKVVRVEQVAYCESIYGCGGFLLRYTLNDGSSITAFTGRSTWMYTCMNSKELGNEFYV